MGAGRPRSRGASSTAPPTGCAARLEVRRRRQVAILARDPGVGGPVGSGAAESRARAGAAAALRRYSSRMGVEAGQLEVFDGERSHLVATRSRELLCLVIWSMPALYVANETRSPRAFDRDEDRLLRDRRPACALRPGRLLGATPTASSRTSGALVDSAIWRRTTRRSACLRWRPPGSIGRSCASGTRSSMARPSRHVCLLATPTGSSAREAAQAVSMFTLQPPLLSALQEVHPQIQRRARHYHEACACSRDCARHWYSCARSTWRARRWTPCMSATRLRRGSA